MLPIQVARIFQVRNVPEQDASVTFVLDGSLLFGSRNIQLRDRHRVGAG